MYPWTSQLRGKRFKGTSVLSWERNLLKSAARDYPHHGNIKGTGHAIISLTCPHSFSRKGPSRAESGT